MSHARSHAVTDTVTDNRSHAVRPRGVTLLQTRPDQTRLVLGSVGGVCGYFFHPSLGTARATTSNGWMAAARRIIGGGC